MSGNIKFCLIIVVGTILFKEKFKFEQFLSVATVLIGNSLSLNMNKKPLTNNQNIFKRSYFVLEIPYGRESRSEQVGGV